MSKNLKQKWVFPAELRDNYDGDTFKLTLDIGFSMTKKVDARLDGVDTPEMSGGTLLTKAAARLARDEAEKLIRNSKEVLFYITVWQGKYGRPVGRISCDGQDLSDYLIERKLGNPYSGGKRDQEAHQVNAQFLKEQGEID